MIFPEIPVIYFLKYTKSSQNQQISQCVYKIPYREFCGSPKVWQKLLEIFLKWSHVRVEIFFKSEKNDEIFLWCHSIENCLKPLSPEGRLPDPPGKGPFAQKTLIFMFFPPSGEHLN